MIPEQIGGNTKAEQVTSTLVAHNPGRVYEFLGSDQMLHFTHMKQPGNVLVAGVTNEDVLQMLIHRVQVLDSEVPCDENKAALVKLQEALQCFKDRAHKVGQ